MTTKWEFENASVLLPVAVGEPGKRSFFICLGEQDRWVRLWLEKQDLGVIAGGIKRLALKLDQSGLGPGTIRPRSPSGQAPVGLPKAELDLREVEIGYEEGRFVMNLSAETVGPQPHEVSVMLVATMDSAGSFASISEDVVAAGRPLCPICGGPMDSTGHACPGKN